MSLTATDEDRAFSNGLREGKEWGYNEACRDLLEWIKNDKGMISVESIRIKLQEMQK